MYELWRASLSHQLVLLRLDVVRQPTGERQQKHHDMVTNMVEVDPPRVTDDDGVINQRLVVVTRGGAGLRVLQPA